MLVQIPNFWHKINTNTKLKFITYFFCWRLLQWGRPFYTSSGGFLQSWNWLLPRTTQSTCHPITIMITTTHSLVSTFEYKFLMSILCTSIQEKKEENERMFKKTTLHIAYLTITHILTILSTRFEVIKWLYYMKLSVLMM